MTGTPIPAEGTATVSPLCYPDTWAGLISELLTPPLTEAYWDNTADDVDIQAARKIAATILGTFLSEECECEGECPSGNYYAFDFEQSEGGWSVPSGGYGEYVSSTGWRTEVVDLGDGRHSKLDITIGDFPAWLTIYEVLNAVIRLSGTGSAIPVAIAMTAYSPTLGTTFHSRTELEMTALGTNTQLYLKPSLNVRNVCHSLTNEYRFSIDIGPYDSTFQAASYTLADLRFWIRLP